MGSSATVYPRVCGWSIGRLHCSLRRGLDERTLKIVGIRRDNVLNAATSATRLAAGICVILALASRPAFADRTLALYSETVPRFGSAQIGWRASIEGTSFLVVPSIHAPIPGRFSPTRIRTYKKRLDVHISRARRIFFERPHESEEPASACLHRLIKSPEKRPYRSLLVADGIKRTVERYGRMAEAASVLGTEEFVIQLNTVHKVPVCGLEPFADLFDAFDSLPLAAQDRFSRRTQAHESDVNDALDKLIAPLVDGDISALCARAEQIARADVQYYERLVTRRNERWIQTIKAALSDGSMNESLVVVGAAHVCGSNSLIAEFGKLGLTITPLH
jgi:hypothetical protein